MELAQSFPREKVINTMWFLNWEFRLNNDDDDDDRMMMNRVGKKVTKYTLDTNFIFVFSFLVSFSFSIYLPLFSLYHNELETEWKCVLETNKKWILIIKKNNIIICTLNDEENEGENV